MFSANSQMNSGTLLGVPPKAGQTPGGGLQFQTQRKYFGGDQKKSQLKKSSIFLSNPKNDRLSPQAPHINSQQGSVRLEFKKKITQSGKPAVKNQASPSTEAIISAPGASLTAGIKPSTYSSQIITTSKINNMSGGMDLLGKYAKPVDDVDNRFGNDTSYKGLKPSQFEVKKPPTSSDYNYSGSYTSALDNKLPQITISDTLYTPPLDTYSKPIDKPIKFDTAPSTNYTTGNKISYTPNFSAEYTASLNNSVLSSYSNSSGNSLGSGYSTASSGSPSSYNTYDYKPTTNYSAPYDYSQPSSNSYSGSSGYTGTSNYGTGNYSGSSGSYSTSGYQPSTSYDTSTSSYNSPSYNTTTNYSSAGYSSPAYDTSSSNQGGFSKKGNSYESTSKDLLSVPKPTYGSSQSKGPALQSKGSVQLTSNVTKSDFQIGKKLGKGNFGEVFIARHKKTGFVCAMKIIKKSTIKQQKCEEQLLRQLKIQFFLNDKHIVALYGFFFDKDNVYLLLEFCSDGQLFDMLKKDRRLSEETTSDIIRQVCIGVDKIHREQIIHRDIKPENIIMHCGVAKICDFGWAVFRGSGLRGTFCGTPMYYAPQMLRGEKYDQEVDIWAIGVLTYELLIGRIPFKIMCQDDLDRILTDEIKFPDYVDVTSNAKDFILKVLDRNPIHKHQVEYLLTHPFLREQRKQNKEFDSLML